ncbi:hypothetical protein B0A55_01706 [Friedmanniomyces simplex]|uniref:Uncharacterized protein n=1 Tax=Friedmanniomyces simplex TaxID=329884 RepID=A0A4U0XZ60_9PEZI|nr:hypothetical protein B0A55_01706 [Friedmanniomyces simplex]
MALDTGILLLVGTTLLLLGGVAKVQATTSGPRTPTNFINITSSTQPDNLYHSASRCLVSLQSWGDAVELYRYNTTYSTITSTVAATSDVTTSTRYSSFYTLCDGIPRAILDGVSTLIPVTVFAQNASTFTETVATIPTSPPSAALSGSPTCSLDSQACRVLWSSWNSAYSGYNGSTATTVLSTLTNGPVYPDPGQASVCPPQPGDNPGQLGPCCALWVSRVQLYYWPVSTANGDLCKGNGSTVPATPTGSGPNTYDLGTTVLTSPTVYLSITMWFQNTGDPCSQTRTEIPHNITTLVPFSSTDISSLCVINKDQSTYSFNYADLNSPVPWSAYACQRSCWNALGSNTQVCNPMTAEFLPYLAIPSPLYSDYEFNQGCAIQPLDNYWFDPPIALTQASRACLFTTHCGTRLEPNTYYPDGDIRAEFHSHHYAVRKLGIRWAGFDDVRVCAADWG